MTVVDSRVLLENLTWRYAVKKFDPTRRIPAEQWSSLERAATLAPSSYGLQPWKLVVVTDAALRARLREASWNQSQITDASHLVVFARRSKTTGADVDRLIDAISATRGTPKEALAEFRGMMMGTVNSPTTDFTLWNSRQVYIALAFFLYTAAQMRIDACPMEGFDAAKYDEILGLPAKGFNATVVATAGYRAQDDWLAPLAKVRYPMDEVIERR